MSGADRARKGSKGMKESKRTGEDGGGETERRGGRIRIRGEARQVKKKKAMVGRKQGSRHTWIQDERSRQGQEEQEMEEDEEDSQQREKTLRKKKMMMMTMRIRMKVQNVQVKH